MNPVTVSVSVGAMVIIGKWSQGKAPDIDNAIGVAGIAIVLSILEQMNERFAATFSILILVTVAMVHVPSIVKAAGLGKG